MRIMWILLSVSVLIPPAVQAQEPAAVDAGAPKPVLQQAAEVDTSGISALPPSAFAYDKKAPLGLRDEGHQKRGDVTIRDIRFKSVAGRGEIVGYIVEPAGPGPFPGILFVHWLGEKNANRAEFLEEAVGLAKKGALSLLVNGMWSAEGWYGTRKHDTDAADAVAQVKDLDRSMDLLLAQKKVDPKRVAYVGHDFGAMYGVLAGAAAPRAKTYVLLAPTVTFWEWFLYGKRRPADLTAYVKQLSALDPAKYVSALAPASVFLQFAKEDEFVPTEKAKAFADAAKEPKLMRVYEAATHAMTNSEGLSDRYRWLSKELGLKAP